MTYIDKVLSYFEELYPEPKCALNFSSPYELLIAVMLSAQCTDKRVNQVTEVLFKLANTPDTMLSLGEEKIKHENLQKNLDELAGEDKTIVYDTGDAFEVFFKESGLYYEVDKNGNFEGQKMPVNDKGIANIFLDEEGNVYVDDVLIDEPYVAEKALGDCNIELPYQVPESRYFVLGDQRISSVDSRNTAVGCIGEDQIVGKIVFRVWPFSRFGEIN